MNSDRNVSYQVAMPDRQKTFRPPPKKHQPKGLGILYEDREIVVVNKASGLLTVSTDKVRENTAYYLLTSYVRRGIQKSRNRVFIVHRLDKDTSGVIVFAKNELAKRYLQDEWHGFRKTYYAVVCGAPREKAGTISSYLAENRAHRVYSVNDPRKGKLARTGYRLLHGSGKYSLLEINLLTGRKNQIRVHLSDLGCPVYGDRKYGKKQRGAKRLALHAASLTIRHPHTRDEMTFTADTPAYFESLVRQR